MSDIFSRSINLLHEAPFARLQQARIAVFGVGGVGGYVCEALVRSGVMHLDIFDNDDVSPSNINRQIIALHSTIGQDKVTAMATRLLDINPATHIGCHRMFYLPENADNVDLSRYDYVVDAVDTLAAKVELAVRCQAANVPLISAMGAGNKLDPSLLRIADIYATSVCPLARTMRTACRKQGIRKLTVAYSTEEPRRPAVVADAEDGRRRNIPASMVFVPAAMGLLIASHVVRQLTAEPACQEAPTAQARRRTSGSPHIVSMTVPDDAVLSLFAEHDDYMIAFLGEDKQYYTRYTPDERLDVIWLLCAGDAPVGCIACRRKAEGVTEVKRLYIREAYRGQGFSRQLLRVAEQYARQKGCTKLFLDTRITLEPAVSLYRASGFSITFQEGLYIQMEKRL